MKNFLRGGLVLCGLLAANAVMTSASAVVLTFNNFAAFQAAATALTVENFDGRPGLMAAIRTERQTLG